MPLTGNIKKFSYSGKGYTNYPRKSIILSDEKYEQISYEGKEARTGTSDI